jgi:CDP-diacylglycerol--glycerol-3-phosphate 3-phosphatidyltransferase
VTLPTKLTFLRIPLTFLTIGLLYASGVGAKVAALVCFIFTGATDWVDGYLARRWHQTSPAGALLDPIADKFFVLCLFMAFAHLGRIPWWIVVLIGLREVLVTAVRLVAARRNVVLSAAKEGKQKTALQMLTLLLLFASVVVDEVRGIPRSSQTLEWLTLWSLSLAAILTIGSGASFFWRHGAVLAEALRKPAR